MLDEFGGDLVHPGIGDGFDNVLQSNILFFAGIGPVPGQQGFGIGSHTLDGGNYPGTLDADFDRSGVGLLGVVDRESDLWIFGHFFAMAGSRIGQDNQIQLIIHCIVDSANPGLFTRDGSQGHDAVGFEKRENMGFNFFVCHFPVIIA